MVLKVYENILKYHQNLKDLIKNKMKNFLNFTDNKHKNKYKNDD